MKRATNVTADADMLDEAKAMGINLSQAFQEALEAKIKAVRAQSWLEQNREAIDAYNRHIEEDGIWSEGIREW